MPTYGSREVPALKLHLLLAGTDDSGFLYLHDLFAGIGNGRVGLDHARSPQEILTCLARTTYHIVLCDYTPGDGMALRLLHDMTRNGYNVPVAFLSDHVDEGIVRAAIRAGIENTPHAGGGDEASLIRALCFAIDLYCKEKRYQKAEDMLRKLWRTVEQTADLVMIADQSGLLEYVNPAFESTTGYSSEEAIGHNIRMLKPSEQPAAAHREMWNAALSGSTFRDTVMNRKKNGETFTVEKTITPLHDGQGKITHLICTGRDISERRRLESQLQQAQKMDAIGRLAGGVAHDFNNLLMVISAYAELMAESLSAEHPLRRNVMEIIGAAGRAADLTRQLLAFGRKQMQALRVLDLNAVIYDISRMLPRLIGEDIQLVILPADDLGKVKADPVQVEQVVMNLAANARDAMPRGGKLTLETANVRLDEISRQRHEVMPAGDYVLLAVTDQGHGISPEHLPHIFEPFYTTKAEGKGTGLGLATVYGIVKQSGGFVWVYSEPEHGTTFKIYLPQVQQASKRLHSAPVVEEAPRGDETILLVEDEQSVRKSEREFLELSGYTVLEAQNGEEALRLARAHAGKIDLMITDVVMPHMGGAQLAGQLSSIRPQMKVLFVSGYAEKTVLQHGAIDVAARFLQKPFSLKLLARKIREVLNVADSSAVAITLTSAG